MKGKIFTPEQATRMLPLVRRIVVDAEACTKLIERHRRALALPEVTPAEAEEHQQKITVLEDRLAECERELEELGIVLEDAREGVVKLYGEINSEIVYLTWRRGDPDVAHWFPIEKTSADRRHIDELHAHGAQG